MAKRLSKTGLAAMDAALEKSVRRRSNRLTHRHASRTAFGSCQISPARPASCPSARRHPLKLGVTPSQPSMTAATRLAASS